MDLGENGARYVVLADRVDRLISVWHTHRSISIAAITVFFVFVLWFWPRGTAATRQLVSPATQEKAEWLDDSKTPPRAVKIFNSASGTATPHSSSRSKPAGHNAKSKPAARVVSGRRPASRAKDTASETSLRLQPYVFFASLTGKTTVIAERVTQALKELSAQNPSVLEPILHDLAYVELDDYFVSGPKSSELDKQTKPFYLIVIPSYDIDSIINNFLEHLNETHYDFRVDTAPLVTLAGYSVFGLGDREGWPSEEKGFCSQAIEVDKWLAKLTGRKRAYPLGLGDVSNDVTTAVQDWTLGISSAMADFCDTGFLGEGVSGSGNPVESDDELDEESDEFPDLGRKKRQKLTADLEDVGGRSRSTKLSKPLAVDFTTYAAASSPQPATQPKPMVPSTSPTYAALTKQGYTIVGTHSGVKICRWTKSALRGRGSCYKNSFYGIASHLCMETTPSLSCSNKCVFCWRHGTNPVSTTWRWQVDDPVTIFTGAKQGHYKKIKMMRGVPGVRADRFEEAMRIRHCALSLVGEPIFYPRINEFVGLLHGEHISSFLVCNAQHPQQLKDLRRVTQLYVSIDASNKDSLRKIDRPLHRDFWERFTSCLDILREKRFIQRTVFRLTLVKGFNVEDEVEGYADLVARGLPCFVEVKGVTYCGTTTAAGAGLTMQNVPFYEEVVEFVEGLDRALALRGLEYGIAAEHAHSCCILLASKRFHKDGKWCTLIDYDKFFTFLDASTDDGDFGPEDYCAPTPEWALFGNGGFDPRDERVDRKGRPKENHKEKLLDNAQPKLESVTADVPVVKNVELDF